MPFDDDCSDVLEGFEQALRATAHDLEASAEPRLTERLLEEALEKRLAAQVTEAWTKVRSQQRLVSEAWPGVGPVDLVLEGEGREPVFVELKCGDLRNCSWDMAKLALACTTDLAAYGLLVAAATVEHWATNPGRELFQSRTWRADLLLRRFGDDFGYWKKQVKTHPKQLPPYWRVADEMTSDEFVVDGEPWELRAVAIEVTDSWLTPVAYLPVASGAAHPSFDFAPPPELRGTREPTIDVVEGSPDGALGASLQGRDRSTILLGEGGSIHGVDLSGLVTNEVVLDELAGTDASGTTRWFASPATRRAHLEQRGLRDTGSAAPDWFEVSGGSGLGAGFELRWTGSELTLARRGWAGGAREDHIASREVLWRSLWRQLDYLDIWSWEPSYEFEDPVMDGFGWNVDIRFIGRSCRSSGYEAVPGGEVGDSAVWSAFELALEDLCGLPLYGN